MILRGGPLSTKMEVVEDPVTGDPELNNSVLF